MPPNSSSPASSSTTGTKRGTGNSAKADGQHGRPKKLSTTLMLIATALLLTLLFPPFYCFFLAPLALVPFCCCIVRRPMRWTYLAAYYLLGLGFFLPNLFWIAPVTIGGFIALAAFVALYFPLFALGLHRLIIQLRLPATVAVPLVWTAVEFLRACFVLGGFPWFLLGNALTPVPLLIQTADIFGVWGLTFLIAMLNGFIIDALRLPLWQTVRGGKGGRKFSPLIGSLAAVAACTIIFVIAYGFFRLRQNTTHPGPRVAVIQANFEQRVKDDPNSSFKVFKQHLDLSREAAAIEPKPDLIAWPETMVTEWIDDDFISAPLDEFEKFDIKGNLEEWAQTHQANALLYKRVLQKDCDLYGVAELLGYGYLAPRKTFDASIKENRTALMLPRPAGSGEPGPMTEYAKVHLVPFGEYIPFRSVPVLGKLMLQLSPYGFDYSNRAGDRWTRFLLPAKTGAYTFATPICFEDAMPEPARMMSAPQYSEAGGGIPGQKTDFLVNVSNDGWFYPVELDQHIQACQLRAVENRIAIARSVNTGNSGFIDSNGRMIKLVTDAQGASIGAVGTAAMEIPIDSRITFYSRIGDLFPIVCGIMSTILVGWTLVRPRRGRIDG